MAGREEYFEVISEINKWFLDYLCLTTWKNFKESKQVTVGERDLIQGKTIGRLLYSFFSITWIFPSMFILRSGHQHCDFLFFTKF